MPRLSDSLRVRSILGRIILLHVIAVAIICVLLPLFLYWRLAHETESLHRITMLEHADILARDLKVADGQWGIELPPALRNLYSNAYGRYAFSVVDEKGNVLYSSLPDRGAIFATPRADNQTGDVQQEAHGDALYLGVSEPKVVDGQPVTVQIAENMRHRDVISDDIVSTFMRRVGWITLPILLVLLAIDILIFRRALRPLTEAAQEAKRIGPRATHVRLPTAGLPSEVLVLVRAVNQAFERLDEGFRAQREFTSDVAHELRTPLAILRARVDTLPEQEMSAALRKDMDRMGRVLQQLLDMAEVDRVIIEPSDEIVLQELCTDVVEYIAPLALREQKEIAFSCCEPAVRVRGDREMLFRALRNLAENALSHSPVGATVEIVLATDASISVLDQGQGVGEEERELIFQRFWRRDRRQNGGVGLGLAIVERIAAAHDAAISVSNRASGGASFSLRLKPLAREPQPSPPRLSEHHNFERGEPAGG